MDEIRKKLDYFSKKAWGRWYELKARQKRVGEMCRSSCDYSPEGMRKFEFLGKVHDVIQRRMNELKTEAESYDQLMDELYYPAKIAV